MAGGYVSCWGQPAVGPEAWLHCSGLQTQRGSLVSTLPIVPQLGHLLEIVKPSFLLQFEHQNVLHALQCFQLPPEV